jgi:hypothetical protein
MNLTVLGALEHGATQVLILGAGFDTLGLQLAPRSRTCSSSRSIIRLRTPPRGGGIDGVNENTTVSPDKIEVIVIY